MPGGVLWWALVASESPTPRCSRSSLQGLQSAGSPPHWDTLQKGSISDRHFTRPTCAVWMVSPGVAMYGQSRVSVCAGGITDARNLIAQLN